LGHHPRDLQLVLRAVFLVDETIVLLAKKATTSTDSK